MDKASFRVTYIKDKDYENLQITYNSVLSDLQITKMLMYAFLATTITLTISTAYLIVGKRKPKRAKSESFH
jgi:hypothetical protein